jgi:lipopolysaccharide biosynthesis glycosyltransferase
MLITLAITKNYAMPLATTLRSITETNRRSEPIEFSVLHDGVSEELKAKVFDSLPEGSAKISWVLLEEDLFADLPLGAPRSVRTATGEKPKDYLAKMAYARLLIPKIFPETVARVLYLDVDVLALEDLSPLWETDLKGAVAGAVPDIRLHTAYVLKGVDPKIGRTLFMQEIGYPEYSPDLPLVEAYFNSGVLLIDLKRWREEAISEKAFDYLRAHPQTPWHDQDALNAATDGRWIELDPRWNAQDHYRKLRSEDRKGILHFVTKAKPWLAEARNANAALYDSFRDRTLFARTPLDRLGDSLVRFKTGINNVRKRGFLKKL